MEPTGFAGGSRADPFYGLGVMMRLECERCVVRPLAIDDVESLAKHGNDREVWINLRDRFPHPYATEDAIAYIKAVGAELPVTSFAIEVDGEACGGIGLHVGTDIERASAEIGYWLGRSHWGRGIMTAAVGAVTEYAFAQLGMIRVWAVPFADNEPSFRVLEKNGYVREGVLRSSGIKDGKIIDQCLYSAIRPPS